LIQTMGRPDFEVVEPPSRGRLAPRLTGSAAISRDLASQAAQGLLLVRGEVYLIDDEGRRVASGIMEHDSSPCIPCIASNIARTFSSGRLFEEVVVARPGDVAPAGGHDRERAQRLFAHRGRLPLDEDRLRVDGSVEQEGCEPKSRLSPAGSIPAQYG
jgi:hypothetical protein